MNSNFKLPLIPVRAYERCAYWFAQYAKIFKVEVTEKEQNYLSLLLNIAWHIDNVNDNIVDSQERIEFQRSILRRIIYGTKSEKFPKNAENAALSLVRILEERDQKVFFTQNIREIFNISNSTRNTNSIKQLFELTKNEGKASGKLALLFVDNSNSTFDEFVIKLSGIGNVLDTLFDFKSDWKNKEIQIRPTFLNYIKYVFLTFVAIIKVSPYFITRPKALFISLRLFRSAIFYSKKQKRH